MISKLLFLWGVEVTIINLNTSSYFFDLIFHCYFILK